MRKTQDSRPSRDSMLDRVVRSPASGRLVMGCLVTLASSLAGALELRAQGCGQCVTDDDCDPAQFCHDGYCSASPPGCTTSAVQATLLPIYELPISEGIELCYRVRIENLDDDGCDAAAFSASLLLPDCNGDPQCPAGTLITVTEDACVPQGDSFICPGPDPRCQEPGDCTIGVGYRYIVDPQDAVASPIPGLCPVQPSNEGPAAYLVAGLMHSGTVLTPMPAPAASCQAHMLELEAEPADLDGDGIVDARDLALLLASWGPCPECAAELTGDDLVDADDLVVMLSELETAG